MDLKELRKSLKSKPRLINILGTESVFRNQAIKEIISSFVPVGYEDFNVTMVDAETDKEVFSLLVEAPFGSNFRLVFTTACQKFQNSLSDYSVLISLDNSIKNPHYTIDCSKLYGRKLKQYIKTAAKNLGLDFDAEDLTLFTQMHSNSLSLLDIELEKLSLVEEKSLKLIKELSKTSLNSRMDEFVKCALAKDISGAFSSIAVLKDYGVTDSQLFGFFVYSIRGIIRVHYSTTDIEEIEDSESRKFFRLQNSFDFTQIAEVFTYLYKYENFIKYENASFELFVLCFIKKDYSIIRKFISHFDEF